MFEIKVKDGADVYEFSYKYEKLKEVLDKIILDGDLDKVIKSIDYSLRYELIDFLNLCERNYLTVILEAELITACHEDEDEMFLNLYNALKNGEFENYFESLTDAELEKINKFVCSDENVELIFPSIKHKIIEKKHNTF